MCIAVSVGGRSVRTIPPRLMIPVYVGFGASVKKLYRGARVNAVGTNEQHAAGRSAVGKSAHDAAFALLDRLQELAVLEADSGVNHSLPQPTLPGSRGEARFRRSAKAMGPGAQSDA